ncbi:hypothetical protein [Streptomyces sp. NPDC127197]|uniref:hypothetical protein n=1 Tax=Streptomyces sp. NPDC127197 TaxID=3345388 RepID=UPI0036335E1A
MTTESNPAPAPDPLHVTMTTNGQRATLVFSGVLKTHMVGTLEEQLTDPRLRQARVWELEMRDLARLALPCAYALLRAATTSPAPTELHVRGARRIVRRTLHEVGFDAVAAFEE